jgi:hypothetical protein
MPRSHRCRAQAQTEVIDPDGSWRTDCLISDADGKPVMAVGIQLPRISLDEIYRRHDNLVRCLPMSCWFVGPALGRYLVQPHARLASWSVPGIIEEAECRVMDKVTRLLTRQLVWHPPNPARDHRIPFRLVGYRDRCGKCTLEFALMPVVCSLLKLVMCVSVPGEPPRFPPDKFDQQRDGWMVLHREKMVLR